jgi:hypothetical protein
MVRAAHVSHRGAGRSSPHQQEGPPVGGPSCHRKRHSGGGIRTRDLRVMRSPKGGQVGPDRPCLLGLARARWGRICSRRNHEWNPGAPPRHGPRIGTRQAALAHRGASVGTRMASVARLELCQTSTSARPMLRARGPTCPAPSRRARGQQTDAPQRAPHRGRARWQAANVSPRRRSPTPKAHGPER